jgi:hypothetical protein
MAMGLMMEGLGLVSKYGQEFLLHIIQTGSGSHPASYPVDAGFAFAKIQVAGHETDHSLPATADVKKTLIYIPTPHMYGTVPIS